MLLVGSPYAGYGNHTNHSNVGSGKWIVFAFSSRAHVQQIYFECTEKPVKGSFKLEMFSYTSSVIPYDADSYLLKTGIRFILIDISVPPSLILLLLVIYYCLILWTLKVSLFWFLSFLFWLFSILLILKLYVVSYW